MCSLLIKLTHIEFLNDFHNLMKALEVFFCAVLFYILCEQFQFSCIQFAVLVRQFLSQRRDKQMDCFADILISVLGKMEEYVRKCEEVSGELEEEQKKCFRSTLYLDAQIHMHCAKGMLLFTEGVKEYLEKNYMQAFYKLGMAAKQYETANQVMRNSEYGAFEGFFENDCFAHTPAQVCASRG